MCRVDLKLFWSQISSSPSSAGLELLAEKSVTMTSAGNNSNTEASLIVKNNMEIIADTFTVTDTLGKEILAVDESNVRYSTETGSKSEELIIILGSGGINWHRIQPS